MFSLRDFVMSTIKGMIGNEPEYKARDYTLGWYNKGVLKEEDLIEIEELLKPIEPEPEGVSEQDEMPEEEVFEEIPEEATGDIPEEIPEPEEEPKRRKKKKIEEAEPEQENETEE